MIWVVDRIEESLAVLAAEDGTTFSVPMAALGSVREGDVLLVVRDEQERARRVSTAKAMLDELLDA